MAKPFNNYFSSIAHTLDFQLPPTNQAAFTNVTNILSSSAFFYPVTTLEVSRFISDLKNTSSKINEIPVWLLKNINTTLSGPLANLINYSISSGVFPVCLKRARIVPIFKKGDTANMSNYRPIALLPTISKIFEKCISTRLINFLDRSNIIINQQFQFLKGRSTTDEFAALTRICIQLSQQ